MSIYKKPVSFALMTAGTVLIGSIVTMAYPMLRDDMHPKLETLKPYTAIQLAGRDIYQREGCVNCHTQTVRPLKSEVQRYGEYSKAGEFAYDHPFLWGSKRTGPDLARIGGKYPDTWHVRHFDSPQVMVAKSNMPPYGWLKDTQVDAAEISRHMQALDFPTSPAELQSLAGKSELDALIAYMQVLGRAVTAKAVAKAPEQGAGPQSAASQPREHIKNPLAGNAEAIAKGAKLYDKHCAECHQADLKGDLGPSLVDTEFIYQQGDLPDDDYFELINNGTEEGQVEDGRTLKGGMPDFKGELSKDDIWSVVAFIRSKQGAAQGK